MKNYLAPIILLFYSFCAFTLQHREKAKTDWDTYFNEVKAIKNGVKSLKSIIQDDFQLGDFELKSISYTGFKGAMRVCTFESSRLLWEINSCGPSEISVDGPWYSLMHGKMTFKDDPHKSSISYFFESHNKNIYFLSNIITPIRERARDITTSRTMLFEFEDQKANMIKFAPPEVIQAFIGKLLSTQHDFIEESFSAE